jgi:hypothetical protein
VRLSSVEGSSATVTYSEFCDLSAFTLNGITPSLNRVIYGGQCVLRLTDNYSQSGSAFLTDPITLADERHLAATYVAGRCMARR